MGEARYPATQGLHFPLLSPAFHYLMLNSLLTFAVHWFILTVLLWLSSKVFHGIEFKSTGALWLSALLLGFANAVIRPVFILFTLPLTLLTFGFFLLVINALMILLVAAIVRGFKVSGFWTAFFASLMISALSLVIDIVTSSGVSTVVPPAQQRGTMVRADSAAPGSRWDGPARPQQFL